MTTLLITFFSLIQSTNLDNKEIDIAVPENIEYLEYCFNSWQCKVPEKYKTLVKKRVYKVKGKK